MITLNIASLTAMCRSFAPRLIERGGGRLVNVASIAAFQAVPQLADAACTPLHLRDARAPLQEFFLSQLVVPAARQRGLGAEYEYLRPSIKAFPTGAEQEDMARAAGFASAVHYDVSFGLMGCLVVQKGGV